MGLESELPRFFRRRPLEWHGKRAASSGGKRIVESWYLDEKISRVCYDGKGGINLANYHLLKTTLTINDLENAYEALIVESYDSKRVSDERIAEIKRDRDRQNDRS